jgi:beta-lactamase regulating signal transducer with metallopeptidase domain/pyruvate/2-oxoglutarate dehydrogenase complex dihydrolipoamide acyltransferase (E2) component
MTATSIPIGLLLELVIGATVILGAGSATSWAIRSPAKRQRAAEFSLAASFLWLGMALVPLPRLDLRPFVERHRLASGMANFAHGSSGGGIRSDVIPVLPHVGADDGARNEVGWHPHVSNKLASVDMTNARISTAGWFTLLYGLGSMMCVIWLAVGRYLLARAERSAVPADSSVAAVYDRISKGRAARVLVSRGNVGPASFGLWRPRILLPARLCGDESALKHILRHEQVHIDRRDAIGHMLLNFALPILYGHPLYWFTRHVISFSRELVADERAARAGSKADYVEHMLRMLRGAGMRPLRAWGTLGFFRLGNCFSRRMEMLIKREEPLETRPRAVWQVSIALCSLSLALALATVLGARRVVAQNADSTDESRRAIPDVAEQVDNPADVAKQPDPEASAEGSVASDTGTLVENCVVRAHTVEVPALETGKIEEIAVHEGSVVKVGQLLAKLADRDARAAVESRKAEVARGERLLDGDPEVRKALTALKTAQKRLELLSTAAKPATGAVTRIALIDAEGEVARAQAEVDSAQKAAEIHKLDLEKTISELRAAEQRLSQFQVRAPASGMIVKIYRQAGEWVMAGDPLARIVDPSQIRIEGFIQAPHLQPQRIVGQHVSIWNGDGVRLASGKVAFASIEKDVNGGHRIRIACENRQEDGTWVLVPGQMVNLRILDKSQPPPQPGATLGAGDATDHTNDIGLMEELVQSAEQTHERVQALYETGGEGGDAANVALSRYYLYDSKARLAFAKGNYDESKENYERAVEAAEAWVKALHLLERQGRTDLTTLINSQRALADAKKNLIRVKQMRSGSTGTAK